MKFDFNKPCLQLDGTPFQENGKDIMLSDVLAKSLASITTGIEPLIALEWGLKLHRSEILDLHPEDRRKLRRVITEGFTGMSLLIKARMLEVLEAKGDDTVSE